MLQQFSWTQFLLTSSVLSIVWYCGVLLTAYRTEFFSFLQGRPSGTKEQPLTSHPDMELDSEAEHDLMGPSKLPDGMEKVSMSAIAFGADHSTDRLHDDQLGLIPDVIWELRQIFELLAKQDGNKSDFFRMVEILGDKYGRIGSNPNISQVNLFIREHAPFSLNAAELENLWN